MSTMTDAGLTAHGRPSRPLSDPVQHYAISNQLTLLRNERTWNESDRNSMTLRHGPQLRIVLIALHAGATMHEHTAPGAITVQVLEGTIVFTAQGVQQPLGAGDMIAVDDAIPHTVHADSDSAILLTLALPDTASTHQAMNAKQ